MSRPPKPFLEEMDEALDPGAAPPVPDALPEGQAMQAVAALSQRRGSALTRFALWAFGALFSFALSVAAWDFVTGLLARNLVLGWAAFVLVVAAVLAGLVLALREWGTFLRLRQLDGLRERAATARTTADLKEARRVVSGLVSLYGARGDTAWGRARLAEREGEVMDADALLALAERELLT
ncbi:MAG: TIGR01620 family protein, partial [Tabrizicola sp.]